MKWRKKCHQTKERVASSPPVHTALTRGIWQGQKLLDYRSLYISVVISSSPLVSYSVWMSWDMWPLMTSDAYWQNVLEGASIDTSLPTSGAQIGGFSFSFHFVQWEMMAFSYLNVSATFCINIFYDLIHYKQFMYPYPWHGSPNQRVLKEQKHRCKTI